MSHVEWRIQIPYTENTEGIHWTILTNSCGKTNSISTMLVTKTFSWKKP